MEKITKTIDVFVAKDGAEFTDETLCRQHEAKLDALAARKPHIRFFEVAYAPDLTEGRGLQCMAYLAIESTYPEPQRYALDVAFHLGGAAVQYIQGYSPMDGWRINPLDEANFLQWRHRHGSSTFKTPVGALFLSDAGPLDGYPPPTSLRAPKETLVANLKETVENR